MNPLIEWLRAHAPLLQQINKGVRRGLVPPGFDLLQDAARNAGKAQGDQLLAIGKEVGDMPRAQDFKNRDEYAKAMGDYGQKFSRAYANIAAMAGVPERDQIASPAFKLPRGAKVDGKTILTGRSHPNIIFDNSLESKLTPEQLEKTKDGFVTMNGKFVSRKQATKIATRSGQLSPVEQDEIESYGNGEMHSGDFKRPQESQLSAAVGRARDRMSQQFGLHLPLMRDESLGSQEAADLFKKGRETPFPFQRDPHAPNSHLKSVADKYVADNAIDTNVLPRMTTKVPAEKGKMMADAYESLKSDPYNPEVRDAYAQFGKEVEAQHKALVDAGYTFDMDPKDPYPNSAAMLKDLRENKRIKVFKTTDETGHPLLTNEQNDMFRAVHDALGHGINGNQFGPKGEEGAFRDHSAMFSPLARRVMATETRGQNSWVNFGPHSDLPVTERPYATQKAALWPEHLMGDYDTMVEPAKPTIEHEYMDDGTLMVRALHPTEKDMTGGPLQIGHMHFDDGDNTVTDTYVAEDHRRKGIASAMADHASGVLGEPVRHSGVQSPAGKAWAAAYDAKQKPAQENWLHSHIAVNEPQILRKVEPIAGSQHDIPRVAGKDLQKVQDVEDLAYKTYTGPQFERWLNAGRDIPGGPNWYDTRATQQKAVDALGDAEGPTAFRDLMNFMGASTAMSRPSNNLRRASWYRGLNMAGLLDPESMLKETLPAPPGFGHIAQRAHHHAVADLLQHGEINPLANPKPASFVENLSGNDRPYTNDTRMATATLQAEPKLVSGIAVNPDGVVKNPRSWAYAPMERAFQRAAREYHNRGLLYDVPEGHDPTATAQAQIWGGIGGWRPGQDNAGSFDNIFDALLSHSAKMWGVSPSEANKLVWQGNPFELPLNSPLLKK